MDDSVEKKIFEKNALSIVGGNLINNGDFGEIIIEIDLSPNSDYNSIDLKTKQIYVRTELQFDLSHTVEVYVSNDLNQTKKLIGTFTTTNEDYTFKNYQYKYDYLINSEKPYIYVEVS